MPGTSGDDFFHEANHIVDAGDGWDTATFNPGILGVGNVDPSSVSYDGGDGSDTLISSGAARIDLAAGTVATTNTDGTQNTYSVVNFENVGPQVSISNPTLSTGPGDEIFGTDGSNRLIGGNGSQLIDGRAGDDFLDGGASHDTLRGGAGADRLRGGDGDDVLEGGTGDDLLDGGLGNDFLRGGAGDDTLIATGGSNTYDGGAGLDVLDLTRLDNPVTVDLSRGVWSDPADADRGAFFGLEFLVEGQIVGTPSNDQLLGSADDDHLLGLGGGDTLTGLDGNDILDGGRGSDTLIGGAGADKLIGGSGGDRFTFVAGNGAPESGLIDTDTIEDFGDGGDSIRFEFYDADYTFIALQDLAYEVRDVTGTGFTNGPVAGYFSNQSSSGTSVAIVEKDFVSGDAKVFINYAVAGDNNLDASNDVAVSIEGGASENWTYADFAIDELTVNPSVPRAANATFSISNDPIDMVDVVLKHRGNITDAWFENAPIGGEITFDPATMAFTYDPSDVMVGTEELILVVTDGSVERKAAIRIDVEEDPDQSPTLTETWTTTHLYHGETSQMGQSSVRDENGLVADLSTFATDVEGDVTWRFKSTGGAADLFNLTSAGQLYLKTETDYGGGGGERDFVDLRAYEGQTILLEFEARDSAGQIATGIGLDGSETSTVTLALPVTGREGVHRIKHETVTFDGSIDSGDVLLADYELDRELGLDSGWRFRNVDPNAGFVRPGLTYVNDPISGRSRWYSDEDFVMEGFGRGNPGTITYMGDEPLPFQGTDLVIDFHFGVQMAVDKNGAFNDKKVWVPIILSVKFDKDGVGFVDYSEVALDDPLAVNSQFSLLTTQSLSSVTSQPALQSELDQTVVNKLTPTLFSIEGAVAGNSDDVLAGGDTANYFDGAGGDDFITGQDGDDTLIGGSGNDALYGDAGDDALEGGQGQDHLFGGTGDDSLKGGSDSDMLYGDAGMDVLVGGAGDDVLDGGDGNDVLDGGAGDDDLAGGAGTDQLSGGSQNDNISGNAGNDSLLGGSGNDVLDGGEGIDVLTGGTGADLLTGGAGVDRFAFELGDSSLAALDEVLDFESGADTIDLRAFIETARVLTRNETGDRTIQLENFFGTNTNIIVEQDGADAVIFADGDADGNWNPHTDFALLARNGGSVAWSADDFLTSNGLVAPVISDQTIVVNAGETIDGFLQASDTDGIVVSYASAGSASLGEVSIDIETGAFTFDAGFVSGTEQISVLATDDHGLTASGLITVEVNTAPEFVSTPGLEEEIAFNGSGELIPTLYVGSIVWFSRSMRLILKGMILILLCRSEAHQLTAVSKSSMAI